MSAVAAARRTGTPVLVRGVVKRHPGPDGPVLALDGAALEVAGLGALDVDLPRPRPPDVAETEVFGAVERRLRALLRAAVAPPEGVEP